MDPIRGSSDTLCVTVLNDDIGSALRVLHGRVLNAGGFNHTRYRRKKTPAWMRRREKSRQAAEKRQFVNRRT